MLTRFCAGCLRKVLNKIEQHVLTTPNPRVIPSHLVTWSYYFEDGWKPGAVPPPKPGIDRKSSNSSSKRNLISTKNQYQKFSRKFSRKIQ